MKVKTSKKQIVCNYNLIVKVGYCNLQNALRYLNPQYYTCGQNGWYADIYEIEPNKIITTGYLPFGNIIPTYDKLKEIDDKASEIYDYRNSQSMDEKNKQVKELLLTLFDR